MVAIIFQKARSHISTVVLAQVSSSDSLSMSVINGSN